MPTYEYACNACGNDFEAFQSMKDAPLDSCPSCGVSGRVRRKLGTGAGLIFKGSGFYETDYRRAGSKGAAEGRSSGEKAAAAPASAPAAAPATSSSAGGGAN